MVAGFNGLLTATVFLPALGALLILLLVRGDRNVRVVAALVGLADLALSILVFVLFDPAESSDRFQLVDRFAWITSDTFRASYLMAVDGLR